MSKQKKDPASKRPASIKYYKVSRCENVHIGDRHETHIHLASTQDDSEEHKPKDDQMLKREQKKARTSKDLAGVQAVSDILHDSPLEYRCLEERMEVNVQKMGFKSFQNLSGWALNDFLILHKDKFDFYVRKQKRFVKMTKIGRRELMSQNYEQHVDIRDKEQHSFEAGSKGHGLLQAETQSIETNPKASLKTSTTIRSDADWYDIELFLDIVQKGESERVKFVDSFSTYENNRTQLSIDIVSMWNTPQRLSAFILIGVDHDRNLLGELTDVNTDSINELFLSSEFTSKPIFKTYTTKQHSKSFYVIEIISSHGYGHPCVSKDTCTYLKPNELWTRHGSQNIVCKQSSVESGLIYQWFLGSKVFMGQQQPLPNAIFTRSEATCTRTENTCTEPEYDSRSEISTCDRMLSGDTFDFFLQKVRHFKNGHFILITGNVDCSIKYLSAFGRIPWLGVYDFDIFSRTHGLYNTVENILGNRRHLRPYCWCDATENITEKGTRWCFLRGCREFSGSRTDCKDGTIEEVSIWFKLAKKAVESVCEKLSSFVEDYTVLNIIILWPEEERLVPFLIKFLSRLTDTLSYSPNVILCMNSSEPVTQPGILRYQTLCQDYTNCLSVCHLPFQHLCSGLEEFLADRTNELNVYKLPKKETTDTGSPVPDLTEKEVAWLGEDLDVLYIDNPCSSSSTITDEKTLQEVNNFYKGGTLPLCAWYNNMAQKAVIDRSVQKQLQSTLRIHLDDYKTSIVTLFHAPGSGGTTLAQKVLWNLHTNYPSVRLKLRSSSGIDELDRKITFLYEHTGLSILLLVDGEEEFKVGVLSRRLKYAVILYVKRHLYKIPTENNRGIDCIYLSGYVTSTESRELEKKFAEKCEGDTRKKERLSLLTADVLAGKQHCMYEYGMTVYLHEFRGIVSYVEGYLELKKGQDLSSIQRCLGYLALVYYYGQTSVPSHFFSPMFKRPVGVGLTLEDMPHPIDQFVVYDNNGSRQLCIRICHYIVAKEILEQILSRNVSPDKERTDTLGLQACWNLSEFCISFINFAGHKKSNGSFAEAIKFILTKTFIFRDEKDMSDNAEQVRRRPVLSRVMIDIPAGKPLFMERLNVLKTLVKVFPDDPNFHAHLGRFYSFCMPDKEETAEQCFQTAIQLCDGQLRGKTIETMEDGLKRTMMHIYHMYGIVKQRYVAKFTGRSHNEMSGSFAMSDNFRELIEKLVPIAQDACEYFTRSREVTPENHDVYTYTYTGEIQVRLQICDFVIKHFKQTSNNNTIQEFLKSNISQVTKSFVHRSIAIIEKLIIECYMDVDLIKSEREHLKRLVIWYNTIFQATMLVTKGIIATDEILERRLRIAELKLTSTTSKMEVFHGIETIADENVLNEIIALYENTFTDVRTHGFQPYYNKRDLERDFRDWIYAIRQEAVRNDYELEKVLNKILLWNEMVMSPISSYYVFILYSLLGFGIGSKPGNTECLIEAIQRRETLIKMNQLVIRPKYPREWIGNSGSGIKRLKVGSRNIGMCTEDRDSTSSSRDDLLILKGTICQPNTNHVNGMISLDLGVHGPDVRVYYIPKVQNLTGIRFAGQRVEFNLAFTIQHGYQAYNVKLLKNYGCSNCSRYIEFTSADYVLVCECGSEVYRDELNEVPFLAQSQN